MNASGTDDAALELSGLNGYYGLAHVLVDVSLRLPDGGALALLGRNGAGKSTLFKAVMAVPGVTRSGAVQLGTQDLTRCRTHEVSRAGVQLVPEDRRILSGLTVWENLQLATRVHDRRVVRERVDEVLALFPEMKKFLQAQGHELSGGQQQMVAVGRALVAKPKVVLMDEPSTGLAPVVVSRLGEALQALRQTGLSMIIAEQNVRFALDVCEDTVVLERGQVVFEGSRDELLSRDSLREQYLEV